MWLCEVSTEPFTVASTSSKHYKVLYFLLLAMSDQCLWNLFPIVIVTVVMLRATVECIFTFEDDIHI